MAGSRFWNVRYRGDGAPPKADPIVLDAVSTIAAGKALDLGCGDGAAALHLATRGWNVTAIDFAPRAIDALRRHAANVGVAIHARIADVFQTELGTDFDFVHLGFLHFEASRRRVLLARAADALRPGGTMLYNGFTQPGGMLGSIERFWRDSPFAPAKDVVATWPPTVTIEKCEEIARRAPNHPSLEIVGVVVSGHRRAAP
jgi:SAM-dependent methyltransferase